MIRVATGLLIALSVAGVIHIAAVQVIPWVAPSLPADRVRAMGGELAFVPLGGKVPADRLDPAFRYAACYFDLSDGPVVVEAAPGTSYWGLSLHDRLGGIFYALNDRSAEQGRVTIVLRPRSGLSRQPPGLAQGSDASIGVTAPDLRGYAVLRLFVPSASREDEISARLGQARCQRASLSST